MSKKSSLLFSSLLVFLLSACTLFPPTEETDDGRGNSEEPVEIVEDEEELEEEPVVEDTRNVVSFYGVGDNLIHDAINDYARAEDGSYNFMPIYEELADLIAPAYLSFINQESIIGGDEFDATGYPTFNTPSAMVGNLVDLGFDIVVGSNNHSLDKLTAGVENTLTYWGEYKDEVLFTGVFGSQEDRDAIPIVESNGLRFAVLTYTYGTNGVVPDAPWRINYFDPDLITDDVTRAKEMSDFVIVAAHMGDEHAFSPNQMQLDYAQLFADLEVDLVMGTHSHTIQPIEWVTGVNGNETLMVYSLGNFLAATTSDKNLLGGSLSLNFVEDEGEYSIEDVHFDPHVIHYEAALPGDVSTRTDFRIYRLADYTDELAERHALTGYEENVITVENYQRMVEEVYAAEFLE